MKYLRRYPNKQYRDDYFPFDLFDPKDKNNHQPQNKYRQRESLQFHHHHSLAVNQNIPILNHKFLSMYFLIQQGFLVPEVLYMTLPKQ